LDEGIHGDFERCILDISNHQKKLIKAFVAIGPRLKLLHFDWTLHATRNEKN
jgi:hypothetical protein